MAPSGKRAARREEFTLELACEWGTCQEAFCGMEEFCQHVEKHYKVLERDSPEVPGDNAFL